jgi:hypothetical protein
MRYLFFSKKDINQAKSKTIFLVQYQNKKREDPLILDWERAPRILFPASRDTSATLETSAAVRYGIPGEPNVVGSGNMIGATDTEYT